jgi:hypothetical protein
MDAGEIAAGVGQLLGLGEEGANAAFATFGELIRAGVKDAQAAGEGLAVLIKTFRATPEAVGDMLAQTAVMANAPLGQIIELMRMNAPLMEAAGWSLKEAADLAGMVKLLNLNSRDAMPFLRQVPKEMIEYAKRRREAPKGADGITDYLLGTDTAPGPSITDASGRLLPFGELAKSTASYIGYNIGQGDLTPAQKNKLADIGYGEQTYLRLVQYIPRIGEKLEGVETTLVKYAADMMDDTKSALGGLEQALKGLVGELTDNLLPALTQFAEKLTEATKGLTGFVAEHPVAGGVGAVGVLAGGAWLLKRGAAWGSRALSRMFGGSATVDAIVRGGGARAAATAAGATGSASGAAGASAAAEAARSGMRIQNPLNPYYFHHLNAGQRAAWLAGGARGVVMGATKAVSGAVLMDFALAESLNKGEDQFGTPGHPWPEMGRSSDVPLPSSGDPLPWRPPLGQEAGKRYYDYSTLKIEIHQLPGESGESLANRVVKIIDERKALSPGGRN